jgi:hypothetical protein
MADPITVDGEDSIDPSSSAQNSAKRFKCSEPLDTDSAIGAGAGSHGDLCQPSYFDDSPSSREWCFQQSFRDRDDPAPAQLEQVGEFHSPLRADHARSSQLCDLICALEFSRDGRLLVAAGVSKQVGVA